MSLAYSALRIVAVPTLRALWTLRAEGVEHLPRTGGAIVAANHLSVSDHLFLPAVCPRKVFFMAKAEYFRGTGLKGAFTAKFMRAVGQIPVERVGGAAARAGLDQAEELIRSGELFGIFPEGTRSPDGRLYKGKTGAVRLAFATGAPVIPVGLHGTDKAQPIGAPRPRPGHEITVKFGAPMDFSRFAGKEPDHAVLREATDEIMARIRELSGQTYVDDYAPKHATLRD
ncbi:1-acyl-sn-glycerol-3-phosphate acyltransferase [Lentzea sp. NBRC 105346]|uniref:lysophospholipid acyltransferase family protein n=1 Tax=Lentzea sp. NBRC 105346 TaxID=3032205 RepID=UPI0024A02B04|nr:lysophospholipid acyltransferase family protein [Lentzea sp. NBRC 105346]GLZ29249.1 1-acyl-sn-glycerol-3-phosphate acyltransferase [Lentzea sp. NBRC 105346]